MGLVKGLLLWHGGLKWEWDNEVGDIWITFCHFSECLAAGESMGIRVALKWSFLN